MRIVPENKLHKRVVILWRIHGVIDTVITYAVFFGVTFAVYKGGGAPVTLAILLPIIAASLVAAGFILIFPEIRYRRFRYHISDDEIIIKKGIVIVTHTVVPMIKIQYTDTEHGPIMRALKLAAVRIMTAGGNVEIPGLIPEEAEQMAERITELVKTVRENV
jgi:membrane protein YdbS with pleckstrin-like domain